MQVRYKKYHKDAKTPVYANDGDACFDFFAAEKIYDPARGILEYDTHVGVEIPEDHVGLIFQRSSVYKTPLLLRNCVGVIDVGFITSIKFKFFILSNSPEQYEVGDKIGQMLIIPRPKIELVESDELTGKRGGWGSSDIQEIRV